MEATTASNTPSAPYPFLSLGNIGSAGIQERQPMCWISTSIGHDGRRWFEFHITFALLKVPLDLHRKGCTIQGLSRWSLVRAGMNLGRPIAGESWSECRREGGNDRACGGGRVSPERGDVHPHRCGAHWNSLRCLAEGQELFGQEVLYAFSFVIPLPLHTTQPVLNFREQRFHRSEREPVRHTQPQSSS